MPYKINNGYKPGPDGEYHKMCLMNMRTVGMGQLLRKVWVYCRVGNGDGFTGDDGYGDFTGDEIFTGDITSDKIFTGEAFSPVKLIWTHCREVIF